MYYILILAVVVERLLELLVAKRNARWAFARGGKEFGHKHYPVMVTLHTALLLGCVIEVWTLHRPFMPWLGWPMLAVVALSQGLRWWCVTTLGPQWNTLVIVIPNASLVRRGAYRWLHHPNYVAVVAEGLALPLVHTAWLTAIGFTLANALLLTVRIRIENSALGYTDDHPRRDDAERLRAMRTKRKRRTTPARDDAEQSDAAGSPRSWGERR